LLTLILVLEPLSAYGDQNIVVRHTMADNERFLDLNESISELLIQDDAELLNSTFELPNFGALESSNRGSRELDSQSTLTC